MEKEVLFQLNYGLYLVTSKKGEKENGCIVNSVMQLTEDPVQIGVGINKNHYTHEMIESRRSFNISIFDQSVTYDQIEKFGFHSGREKNKFTEVKYGYDRYGFIYLREMVCGTISVEVTTCVDLGSHTFFIGTVKDMKKLSYYPSLTYREYHERLKPKSNKRKGYRCSVCGYVYEGDHLPNDFICPICQQTSEMFEKIE